MGRRVTFVARCPSLDYQKGMNMRRFNCLLAVPLFVWGAAGSVPVECILSVNFLTSAHAQSQPPAAQQGAREVPSRAIPVPDTVSPQMQAVIARPFDPSFNLVPQTTAEWKARVEKVALATVAGLPKLRAAGIEAVLQMWEGQSHAQYMSDITAPEVKEYHNEVARFFDLHLGR